MRSCCAAQGNYIQYPVINHNGEEYEKECVCTYINNSGLPWGSDGKESACNPGDPDSIPVLERSTGEGNGNPLQYSSLGNPWIEEAGGLQSMRLQELNTT